MRIFPLFYGILCGPCIHETVWVSRNSELLMQTQLVVSDSCFTIIQQFRPLLYATVTTNFSNAKISHILWHTIACGACRSFIKDRSEYSSFTSRAPLLEK